MDIDTGVLIWKFIYTIQNTLGLMYKYKSSRRKGELFENSSIIPQKCLTTACRIYESEVEREFNELENI